MGGCRAQLWTIIGALALIWACGGTFLVISNASNTPGADQFTVQDRSNYISNAIVGGSAVYLCSGIPVMLIAGSLANGARREAKQEKQHQELVTMQHQNAVAMQQIQAQNMALQQQALQQQARSNPSLASPARSTQEIRPQLEAAKTLIDAKQYTQARNLLKTIDHPKAAEWLSKLDNMKV